MSTSKKMAFAIPVMLATLLLALLLGTATAHAAGENVTRQSGADRYETAIMESKAGWPADKSADVAIIATGNNFPDALSATGLAGASDAPILLTGRDTLHRATAAELKRLKPAKIYIVGDGVVVGKKVQEQLKGLSWSPKVVRLSGDNRFKTNLAINQEVEKLTGGSEVAFVATGNNYPDALSVGAYAFMKKAPITLTDGTLSKDNKAYLKKIGAKRVFIAGGSNVVSSKIASDIKALGMKVERLSGDTRYDTNLTTIKRLNEFYNLDPYIIGIATGENFPDALTGAASLGKRGGMIGLTHKANSAYANKAIKLVKGKRAGIRVEIIGSDAAVSNSVEKDVIKKSPAPEWNADFPRTYIGKNGGWVECKNGIITTHFGGTEKDVGVIYNGLARLMRMPSDMDAYANAFDKFDVNDYFAACQGDSTDTRLVYLCSVAIDYMVYHGDGRSPIIEGDITTFNFV